MKPAETGTDFIALRVRLSSRFCNWTITKVENSQEHEFEFRYYKAKRKPVEMQKQAAGRGEE